MLALKIFVTILQTRIEERGFKSNVDYNAYLFCLYFYACLCWNYFEIDIPYPNGHRRLENCSLTANIKYCQEWEKILKFLHK